MKIRYATISKEGRRSNNEDFFVVMDQQERGRFWGIVCDGMGGHACGEVVRDTVVTPNEFTLHSISYAQVVTDGKGKTYLVQVLLARKEKPTQQEAVNLVQNVVGLLRK